MNGGVLLGLLLGAVAVVVTECAPRIEDPLRDNLLQADGDDDNVNTTSRSLASLTNYLKSHQVDFPFPFVGSTVTLDARNLDDDELELKVKLDEEKTPEGKNKLKLPKSKFKIRKIIAPLFLFVLLKTLTWIPLALGIFTIKAFNAMQLAMVSFVSVLGLAVWKLCSKVNQKPPQIVHQAWDPHHHHHHHDRSDVSAQQLAYAAYVPQQQQQNQQ